MLKFILHTFKQSLFIRIYYENYTIEHIFIIYICPDLRPLLSTRKLTPKKKKKPFFQDKFNSLKAHAHYFTVLIYLATSRAAKLGKFTHFTFTNLPQCSQSINSLTYVYSIQIPSCFFWKLSHIHDHTFLYYHHPKHFLYYPLYVLHILIIIHI